MENNPYIHPHSTTPPHGGGWGASAQGAPRQGAPRQGVPRQGVPQPGGAPYVNQVRQPFQNPALQQGMRPQPAPQQNVPLQSAAPSADQWDSSGGNPQDPGHSGGSGGRKRSRIGCSIVGIISAIIALCALGAFFYIEYTYWAGQKTYDDLTEYVEVPETLDKPGQPPITLGSFKVDWDALREINSDVVGWVYLPGTVINYPIVWLEDDDKYYMTHNFGGTTAGNFGAEYGCPVLASVNSPKWTDQVSFVAGHHMRNGTVFSFLEEMADSDTFNENRTFYLLTPEGNFRLTAFACDKIHGSSDTTVIPNFPTKEEFKAYLNDCVDESLVDAEPPTPSVDDIQQVVAFYTCSEPDNRYRIMVYCAVEEFLPAGSDASKSNSLVSEEDIGAVEAAAGERLE